MGYVGLSFRDTSDGSWRPIPVLSSEPEFDDFGIAVRVVDTSEVSASGTIAALNDSVTLEILGRRVVGIHVVGALAASMDLLVQHSYDGVNWGEREFWNGDNGVVFDHLPHPLNNERFYSVVVGPAIRFVRLTAFAWTSGSVGVQIIANEQDDATLYSGVFTKSRQSIPTTLDDVNDAVTMTNYGDAIGFFVEAGSLTGTLVVEGNPLTQGGVWVNVPFWANNAWRTAGYAIAAPGTGFGVSPLMSQAFASYRLRLSIDGGGSCVAHGRCGGVREFIGITHGIPLGTAPVWAEMVGGKDSTGAIQAMRADVNGAVVVTGEPVQITTAITGSATPDYTSGDILGTDTVLTNVCRANGGMTRLDSLVITNNDITTRLTGSIVIFNADPAGTFTDNSACPDLTADIAKIVGVIPIATTDWTSQGTVDVAHIKVDKFYKSAATRNLWFAIVTTAALNLSSNGDYGIYWNFEPQ